MGKISRSPACGSTMERLRAELKDGKQRSKRKKRRKDLDTLRQNVLEMRKNLRRKPTKSRGTSFTKLLNKFADKRHENDSRTQPAEEKDRRGARICNRLLPKSTAGIFAHGAKGKDIRKANLRLSELDEARLQGNVFKLVNGDESGTKDGLAEKVFGDILNGTADCSKGSEPEIVGERANAGASHGKECKKKQDARQRQEDVSERRGAKADESERSEADPAGECADKVPRCKRRLFQGKRDDSAENETANSVESAFPATAYGPTANDKGSSRKPEDRPINYQDYCWSPITRYRQLVSVICEDNFDGQDYLKDNPDETLAKIKDRLKIHLRGDGSQAYRTKIRRCLHDSGSTNSRTHPLFYASDQSCIEVQACTYAEESESPSPRYFRDLGLDIHAEDCEEAILQKGDDLVSIIPANREADQSENVNDLQLTCLPSDLFERPCHSQENHGNVSRLVEAGVERSSHDSRDRKEAASLTASLAASCDPANLKNFVESDAARTCKGYLLARYLHDVDGSIRVDRVPQDCEVGGFKDRRENAARVRRGVENSRHVPAILRRANNNNFAKSDGAGLIDNANPSDEECRVVFARVPPGKNSQNQDAEESVSSARSWRSLRREEDFLLPDSMTACQRDADIMIMPSSRCVKRSRRKESLPVECRANVRRCSHENRERGGSRTSVDPSKPRFADKDERSDFANSQSASRLQDEGSQERQNDGKNLRLEPASRSQYYHDSMFTVQLVGKDGGRQDFANRQSMLRLPDVGNQDRESQYYPDPRFTAPPIDKSEARPVPALQDADKEQQTDGKSYRTNVDTSPKFKNQYYPDSQFTIQLVNRNETRPDFRGNLQNMLSSHGNGNQDRHDIRNYRTSIDMIHSQQTVYYPDPKFNLQLVNRSDPKSEFLPNLRDKPTSQDNQVRQPDVKNYRSTEAVSRPQSPYYQDSEFTIKLVNKTDFRPNLDPLNSQDNVNQDRQGIKDYRTKMTSKPQDQYDPEFTMKVGKPPEAKDFRGLQDKNSNRQVLKNLPSIQLKEEEEALAEDVFEPASRQSRECHRFLAPRQTLPDDKRPEYYGKRYGVQGTGRLPPTSGKLRFSDSVEPASADVGILNSVQNLRFLTLDGTQDLPGVGDCLQPDKYLAYENEASRTERIPVYLPDAKGRKSVPHLMLVPAKDSECDYVLGQRNREAGDKDYFPCKPICREGAGEVVGSRLQVRETSGSSGMLQRKSRDREASQKQGKLVFKDDERQEMVRQVRQVRQVTRKIGVLVPKGYARQTFGREVYLARANHGCDDGGVTQFQANGIHSQAKYAMQESEAYTLFPNSNL